MRLNVWNDWNDWNNWTICAGPTGVSFLVSGEFNHLSCLSSLAPFPVCSPLFSSLPLAEGKRKCQYSEDQKAFPHVMARIATHDSRPTWVADSSPCGTPIPKQPAGLSRRTRRISMKQDARKNLHRRKRQKKRLAMRKYIAEKKSKGVVA
jgi:hypothetical protein